MSKIAIVGASWLTRVLLGAQLEEEGHHVQAFESLYEVLGGLRVGLISPHLLLLDTSGGNLDAVLLKQVRTLATGMPVLILTGPFYASQIDLAALGFVDVLVRPFFVRDVMARVDRLLHDKDSGPDTNRLRQPSE